MSVAIVAALISAPFSYCLISERLKFQSVKKRLRESLAEQDRVVSELQLRRQDAERAQAAAEVALAQYAESEAGYRLLTDKTTDLIIRYGPQGLIEFASPSVRRFGYEPEALIGRNMGDFTHPDDQAWTKAAREHVAGGGPLPPDAARQMRCLRADGEWIWMEGSPSPITDQDGTTIGAVTVMRDITTRRALEDELRQRRAEAEAAVVAKSDFLANMTHELRTPLNAIVGFSGLLKQSQALNAHDTRQVGLICDASKSLLHVVNDLLDFSKLEAGAIELEQHPFDPVALAETIVDLMSNQAAAKDLLLSVRADGGGVSLLGDEARLRQVLLNFVSNAIKFTEQGGVTIAVSLSPRGAARSLRVEVADTGIGIHPDQLESVFGRFTQADASVSRRFGGTGLGLAICKRIIEAMGGEIGVVSTEGQGSTFWFELPAPIAEAAGDAQIAGAEPVAIDRAMRLLVVDDNAVNRELICTLLAQFDIDIQTAADGVEAVEAASRSSFDLILMDVQMPNMDGLTATRHIRAAADPDAPRTPIIAMTANALPEQAARCIEAGMDDHLIKPINPARLLTLIDQWSAADPAPATMDEKALAL